jgi:hypothetical protein
VIDLVLVYKYDADQEMAHTRKYFQNNLLLQGLKLQEEKGKVSNKKFIGSLILLFLRSSK